LGRFAFPPLSPSFSEDFEVVIVGRDENSEGHDASVVEDFRIHDLALANASQSDSAVAVEANLSIAHVSAPFGGFGPTLTAVSLHFLW